MACSFSDTKATKKVKSATDQQKKMSRLLKRWLSNRRSAQRSRRLKAQTIAELQEKLEEVVAENDQLRKESTKLQTNFKASTSSC